MNFGSGTNGFTSPKGKTPLKLNPLMTSFGSKQSQPQPQTLQPGQNQLQANNQFNGANGGAYYDSSARPPVYPTDFYGGNQFPPAYSSQNNLHEYGLAQNNAGGYQLNSNFAANHNSVNLAHPGSGEIGSQSAGYQTANFPPENGQAWNQPESGFQNRQQHQHPHNPLLQGFGSGSVKKKLALDTSAMNRGIQYESNSPNGEMRLNGYQQHAPPQQSDQYFSNNPQSLLPIPTASPNSFPNGVHPQAAASIHRTREVISPQFTRYKQNPNLIDLEHESRGKVGYSPKPKREDHDGENMINSTMKFYDDPSNQRVQTKPILKPKDSRSKHSRKVYFNPDILVHEVETWKIFNVDMGKEAKKNFRRESNPECSLI